MSVEKKIAVAIVGYGNIGQYAAEALSQETDMELCCIVDPFVKELPAGLSVPLVASIDELPKVDVALLAVPTHQVLETGKKLLCKGLRIADIFDIHGQEMWELYKAFDQTAKANGGAALIASGWDPGVDSVIRAAFRIMIPRGITHTSFGPGMSMGHSVAARAVPGVADAVSITTPKGIGLHTRAVYVKAQPGADQNTIELAIKQDPYFVHDETYVYFIDNLEDVRDFGHGSHIERRGRAGIHYNQWAEYRTRLNNPAVTSQVLVAAGRAIARQPPGAYTVAQIPLADFICISTEELVKTMI